MFSLFFHLNIQQYRNNYNILLDYDDVSINIMFSKVSNELYIDEDEEKSENQTLKLIKNIVFN